MRSPYPSTFLQLSECLDLAIVAPALISTHDCINKMPALNYTSRIKRFGSCFAFGNSETSVHNRDEWNVGNQRCAVLFMRYIE